MSTLGIGFNLFKQITQNDIISNNELISPEFDLDNVLFISWSSIVYCDGNFMKCLGFVNTNFTLPSRASSAVLCNNLLYFVRDSSLEALDTSQNLTTFPWKDFDCKNTESVHSNGEIVYIIKENSSLFQLQDRIWANIPLPNVTKIQSIDCGIDHTIGLTQDGQVLTWGIGSRGQLGHGSLLDTKNPMIVEAILGVCITKAKAGGWHSILLAESGDLYVFGWNNVGQLGFKVIDETQQNKSSNESCSPSVGMAHTPMLLELESYLNTSEFATFVDIACGTFHSVAVTKSGNVLSWGQGKYGQLGHNCCRNQEPKTEITLLEDKSSCLNKAHLPGQVDVLKYFISTKVKCGPWNTFIKYNKET